MNEKDLALADAILEGITGTDEWAYIQMNDPRIKYTEGELDKALAVIEGSVSERQLGAIKDAACTFANAFGDAAMLYGMHASSALANAMTSPCMVSKYIVERVYGRAPA